MLRISSSLSAGGICSISGAWFHMAAATPVRLVCASRRVIPIVMTAEIWAHVTALPVDAVTAQAHLVAEEFRAPSRVGFENRGGGHSDKHDSRYGDYVQSAHKPPLTERFGPMVRHSHTRRLSPRIRAGWSMMWNRLNETHRAVPMCRRSSPGSGTTTASHPPFQSRAWPRSEALGGRTDARKPHQFRYRRARAHLGAGSGELPTPVEAFEGLSPERRPHPDSRRYRWRRQSG